eukprot:g20511.t1
MQQIRLYCHRNGLAQPLITPTEQKHTRPKPPKGPSPGYATLDGYDGMQDERDGAMSTHFEDQGVEELLSAELWRALCPFLSVEGQRGDGKPSLTAQLQLRDQDRNFLEEFVTNGFFKWEAGTQSDTYFQLIDYLAQGVNRLVDQGYPATFIYAYDEAWWLIRTYTPNIRKSNGGSQFLGDIYAWKVDPRKGQKGWGPHRDRMGTGPESFRKRDKTAMLSTCWLALTNANPSNSCLYFLPAPADPLFFQRDQPNVDPLAEAFSSNVSAYQAIRAFPTNKGSFLHFSHRTIHWGSFATPSASFAEEQHPRIAMSWVVGDRDFEHPAVTPNITRGPDGRDVEQEAVFPLQVQLALAAAQQILYAGQTGLPKRRKNMYFRMFEQNSSHFTTFYNDKVRHLYYLRDAAPPTNPIHEKRKPTFDPNTKLDHDEISRTMNEVEGLDGLFPSSDDSAESDTEDSEESESEQDNNTCDKEQENNAAVSNKTQDVQNSQSDLSRPQLSPAVNKNSGNSGDSEQSKTSEDKEKSKTSEKKEKNEDRGCIIC